MEPFLSKVAEVYIQNESKKLVDYCFVFPNKRSGAFFRKYLSEALEMPILLPEIITISDLISEFSVGIEASRYEQLFILYNVYKSISDEVVEFDQFQFWGDMILNDFNDVDRYLVDPKQLFINVQRLKEINSNYLTEEQIKIINKYWGENRSFDSIEKFWKHLDNEGDNGVPRNRFLKLWEILYDLYFKFNDELTKKGLTYSGRSYKDASERIAKFSAEDLTYKKYIFVGFNVLSSSEIKIFESLKGIGCADFYWDYNSLVYNCEYNKATRFIRKYIKLFPSNYNIDNELIKTLPNISIIGVPSNVGQVKETGRLLSELSANKIVPDIENALNTAIVLPDENLFIPLIHSLPDEFKSVNITMGYPVRFTSISALMKAIVSMQLRLRKLKGEYVFYYEDIQNILAQPLIRTIANKECEQIQNDISCNRLFNISVEYLNSKYPQLGILFTPVKDIKDFNDVFAYAISLVEFIRKNLSEVKHSTLDVLFLTRYTQALQSLNHLVGKYEIVMQEHTFFHLIERAISSDTINFQGEPLKGLQIMGVLETRALNFENVIMLSMNERVFPRKHFSRSFIPDALRRGYGMSTIEFQESIYAYYFYRLISRAKNVYLLYDARTAGVKSGEMSRYLYQLKFLYPQESIKTSLVDYDIQSTLRDGIEVPKTKEIIEKLDKFRTEGSGKALSASAIKKYCHCPLQFYLEIVEELRIEEDVKEYMDDITYGNIVHAVAEKLYKRLDGIEITAQVLDNMKNDTAMLSKEIIMAVNEYYNKLGKNNDTELYGEAKVLAEIMLYSITELLEQEKQFAPIIFKSAEEKMVGSYNVSPKLTINIKLFIDRVDKIKVKVNDEDVELLRIVDYKTGSDKTSVVSFVPVFDSSNADNNGAILQMFIYCNFYAALQNYDASIQPIIYKLRTLKTEGLQPIKIGSGKKAIPVCDYREFNDEFLTYFHSTLEEIFNPEIPFAQTKNDDHCKYCSFKTICSK